MATIKEMINKAVAAAIAEQFGSDETIETAARKLGRVDTDGIETAENDSDDAGPVSTRKRAGRSRRFAVKVQYVMVPVRANAAAATKDARKRTIKALTPALAEVWNYVSKHSPTTVREMEQALDRGNKSIQSSVHSLRTLGLIESQPVNAE